MFGELKTVRLPKKYSGTGSHRGFAFVDFLTKHDAKVGLLETNNIFFFHPIIQITGKYYW